MWSWAARAPAWSGGTPRLAAPSVSSTIRLGVGWLDWLLAGSRALGCDLAQQGQVGEAHGISLAAPLGKPVQADQGRHEKQRQQRDRILEGQAGASSLGPPGRPR